ncbi:MAG TPA: hypothetical protein VLH09_14100, partial [Bryobacteraceae bacterium]|nr:hypothetical protein [Bryobacteraceae bacterium]
RPIRFSFPNDYKGIHHALASGQPAAPDSELGKRFSRAAAELLAKSVPEQSAPRKFVEYFSLAPGRYTLLSSGKRSA